MYLTSKKSMKRGNHTSRCIPMPQVLGGLKQLHHLDPHFRTRLNSIARPSFKQTQSKCYSSTLWCIFEDRFWNYVVIPKGLTEGWANIEPIDHQVWKVPHVLSVCIGSGQCGRALFSMSTPDSGNRWTRSNLSRTQR